LALWAKNATFLLAEGNQEKNRDFLKKIGSNFQVAEKSLSVEFKNPWKLLVEFNSELTTSHARQRKNPLKSNWRKGWDSCPKTPFFESNLLTSSRYTSIISHCTGTTPPLEFTDKFTDSPGLN
jgi:hypothetical protein